MTSSSRVLNYFVADACVAQPRPLRPSRRDRHTELPASWLELFHKSSELSYYLPQMPIDPELLEILACPNCKTPVKLVKNDTALKCDTCKRVYPIKDEIPVMLIDEATIEQ